MMDKYAVTVCSFSQSKRVLYNSQNVHQLACVPVCAGVRACVRPGLVRYRPSGQRCTSADRTGRGWPSVGREARLRSSTAAVKVS